MGNILINRNNRVIRFVERHQGIAVDGLFVDGQSGRQFEASKIPARYLAEDRDAAIAGDLDAQKRAIIRAIDDDYDFRALPYEPRWENYKSIGTATTVAEAMDQYYKSDRLNREGGTRDRLIRDREIDVELAGYTLVASHHDAIGGRAVYIRRIENKMAVYIDNASA